MARGALGALSFALFLLVPIILLSRTTATALASPLSPGIITTAMSHRTAATSAAFAIRIRNSGVASVNMDYQWTSAKTIPPGFAKVCQQNNWNVESTWNKLNGERDWLRAPSNEAYIYQNSADNHWWIDEPGGMGVFIAPIIDKSQNASPPTSGWRALAPNYEPLPSVEEICASD